jgi:hypothetical protein
MSGRTITDDNINSEDKYCYRDCYLSKGTGIHRQTGWITPSHHLLYNIIRGKPIENGFTPRIWKRHIQLIGSAGPEEYVMRYYYYFDGFRDAAEHLIFLIKRAVHGYNDINKGKLTNMTFTNLKQVREFLEPFNDSVTLTDLCSIDTGVISDYLHRRFKQYSEIENEIATKKQKEREDEQKSN